MKSVKRVITLGFLVCFVAGMFAGCGTSGNDLLDTAVQKANSAKSMEVEATMDMGMKTKVLDQEQDVDMKYAINMSAFQEPLKVKMDVKMDMTGMAMDIKAYIVVQNGEIIQYMDMGQLGGWVKQVLGKEEDMKNAQEKINQMDAAMFMNKEYTYKEQPDAEENGKKYKVYTCAYTEQVLKNLIGSMDSVSASTDESYSDILDEEMLKDIVKSMEGLEFTIWLDPENEELYRVKVSMSEAMQKVMQKVVEKSDESSEQTIDITKMDMDIKYKNYDKAADFELPSEALSATDMSELEG